MSGITLYERALRDAGVEAPGDDYASLPFLDTVFALDDITPYRNIPESERPTGRDGRPIPEHEAHLIILQIRREIGDRLHARAEVLARTKENDAEIEHSLWRLEHQQLRDHDRRSIEAHVEIHRALKKRRLFLARQYELEIIAHYNGLVRRD